MEGERYKVTVEFAASMAVGSLGSRVSKFESLLPGASVRLVRESPEDGVGEVEVCLASRSPAMALRDVSRAVELVGHNAPGAPADNVFAEVRRASVSREDENA